MNHSEKIVQFFDNHFNQKKCHELCRKYKFIERSSSKLRGYEFIKAMVIPSPGLSTDSLIGLCRRIEEFNADAKFSPQALCERINDVSSARLMKGLFMELLQSFKAHFQVDKKLGIALVKFNRILLEDSSCITLNEKLESIFTGNKRASANIKSQLKIDVIYDLTHGATLDANLFRGNEPDQALAGRVVKFLEPGDLLIRDLGYFSIIAFKAIALARAYFLSRLMPRVHFYLNKEDKEPLDLGSYLGQKRFAHLNVIELQGYLGQEKIPSRLIVYRQPVEVTDKRLREARKYGKNKTMTKSRRICLQFSMFVSNAPIELLPSSIIGTVYRLRWEIELVFKRWKDQLHIDYLKGIKQERVECLIWSRLCSVLLVELVCGYFKKLAEERFSGEFSEVKFIQYLLRNHHFLRAVLLCRLEEYFKQLEQDIPRMLMKGKRKRTTMREKVFSNESYYFSYQSNNQRVA